MAQIKKKDACPNSCGNMKLATSRQCGECNRAAPNTGGKSKQAGAWATTTSTDFLRRGLINAGD